MAAGMEGVRSWKVGVRLAVTKLSGVGHGREKWRLPGLLLREKSPWDPPSLPLKHTLTMINTFPSQALRAVFRLLLLRCVPVVLLFTREDWFLSPSLLSQSQLADF